MNEISEKKWYRIDPRLLSTLVLTEDEKKYSIGILDYYFKVRPLDRGRVDVWNIPFSPWRLNHEGYSTIHPRWLIEIDWLDENLSEEDLNLCSMLGMRSPLWIEDQK